MGGHLDPRSSAEYSGHLNSSVKGSIVILIVYVVKEAILSLHDTCW
jgi:hypothetical protein